MKLFKNTLSTLLCIFSITLLLSSCAHHPKPTTSIDRGKRIQKDWQAMFVNQEPIHGSVNLYHAMARALKYNLDLRLKSMEIAVGKSSYYLAKYNMLPDLIYSEGFLARTNLLASSSRSLVPGAFIKAASSSFALVRSRCRLVIFLRVESKRLR